MRRKVAWAFCCYIEAETRSVGALKEIKNNMNQREIKFRAWDIANKEMYQVGTLVFEKATGNLAETNPPDLIMQYTGLKDKNGKEIYEGDILNSLYRNDGCKGVYEVVWHETSFRIRRHGIHQQTEVSITMSDLESCEVIGNIYSNPELLK